MREVRGLLLPIVSDVRFEKPSSSNELRELLAIFNVVRPQYPAPEKLVN